MIEKSNWHERGVLSILFVMQFCHIMDFVIMMPLGPQLMRVFNISMQQFGLLVSAYAMSAGCMGVLAAFFTDRFDRKKTLLFIYTGFAIGTLFCALAPNFHLLLIARIIAGGFGGLVGSTALSIVGDIIPFERRGMAIGCIMSAFAVSSVIGIPLGLHMAILWGWHGPFMFLAILSLLLVPVAYKLLPPIRGHLQTAIKKALWKDFLLVVKNPVYLRAYGMMSALTMSAFFVIPYISPYAVFNVGILESDLAWIYFCGGLFTFFSTNLIGRMTDRYGAFHMLTVAIFLSIIPILLLTHVPKVHLGVFLVITTFFMMCTSGRFTPAMHLINSLVNPSQRGAFMSMSFSIQQLSLALAAYLSGVIIQKTEMQALLHYNWVGLLSVSLTCIAFVLAYSLRPHIQQR